MEIIVIDSGSKEDEGEIVRAFQAKRNDLHYLRTEQRESLYQAWNRGIEMAKGKYLTNGNTDDRHEGDCLERLSDALEEDEQVGLVYGQVEKVSSFEISTDSESAIPCPSQEFFPASLFLHYFYGAQPMWRASLHRKIGLFSGSYEIVGDYEFALRLIAEGLPSKYVPEAKGKMLWREDSLSLSDSGSLANEERRRLFAWSREESMVRKVYRAFPGLNEGGGDGGPEEDFFLDLGLRALCFFPAFGAGKPDLDLHLLEFAYSQNPDDPRFLNNKAILDFILGKPMDAKFSELAASSESATLKGNLEIIASAELQGKPLLFGPSRTFPTEAELRKTESGYLMRSPHSDDQAFPASSLFRLDLQGFRDAYFDSGKIDELSQNSKTYLWGINEKAKLLISYLSQTDASFFLLDSDRTLKSFLGRPIHHPELVLDTLSEERCFFVLCMNLTQGKKMEGRIRLHRPNATTYHLQT